MKTAFLFLCLSILLVPPASARVVVRGEGTAFVTFDGMIYDVPREPHRLIVEQRGDEFFLSGFGIKSERVTAHFDSWSKRRRRLVFKHADHKSERRPVFTLAQDGVCSLKTTRLTRGRLWLLGEAIVDREFTKATFTTNAMKLKARGGLVKRFRRLCASMLGG